MNRCKICGIVLNEKNHYCCYCKYYNNNESSFGEDYASSLRRRRLAKFYGEICENFESDCPGANPIKITKEQTKTKKKKAARKKKVVRKKIIRDDKIDEGNVKNEDACAIDIPRNILN